MTATYFMFLGTDCPGMEAVRSRIRDDHRAYIRRDREDCRVVAGGPLTGDDGQGMFGTLLVLEATDRDAALRFLAGDPYAEANLFARTDLHRWLWGLGNPPEPSGQRG